METQRRKNKLSTASKLALKQYLQRELASRIGQNPNYSLRAFAKSLDIDSGFLSRILSGKREITQNFFNKTIKRLTINADELKEITGASSNDVFKSVSVEHFKVISDWYHYAILELTRIKNFKSDEKWIANKLGISIHEARDAIARLKKLEYLIEDKKGNLIDVSGNLNTIHNDFTNAAFKNLQKQVINKAGDALRETPFEERSQSSLTFALPMSEVPEIKKMIREFNNKLTEYIETKVPSSDSVYHYSVSLYPVTNKEN